MDMDFVALPKIEVRRIYPGDSAVFSKTENHGSSGSSEAPWTRIRLFLLSYTGRWLTRASFLFSQLHAHLSGSISRQCLHEVWLMKKEAGETDLADPLVEMPEGKHDYDLKT